MNAFWHSATAKVNKKN